MMPEILITVSAASLIGVLGWIVRKLSHVGRQIDTFKEDWFGDPPRPGYKGRLSVPERLALVEEEIREIKFNVTPHPTTHSSHDEIMDMLSKIEERVNGNAHS